MKKSEILNKIEVLSESLLQTKNEIDALKSELENTTDEKVNRMSRVDKYGEYYYISEDFDVSCDSDDTTPVDDGLFEVGNYFKDKEFAKQTANMFKLYLLKLKFAEDHNDCDIDWNDADQYKYYICYNYGTNKFYADSVAYSKRNDVCFTSREVAEKFIEKHGNEMLSLMGIK